MKQFFTFRFILAALVLFVVGSIDKVTGMIAAGAILAGPSFNLVKGRLAVGAQESPELEAIKKVSDQVAEFKKNLGDKANKSDIDDITKQIEDLKKLSDVTKINESVTSITKQLSEMAEDVAAFKNGNSASGAAKTIGEQVVAKLKEMGISSKMNKTQRATFDVEVNKAAGTMTTSNVTPVGTGGTPFSNNDVEGGITRTVRRKPWILGLGNVSRTNKKFVSYAEQKNPDGAAAQTAEGAAKSQMDFDWVEVSKEVVKTTGYIKVSKEALDDLDGLRSEIDTELAEVVLLKVDDGLLNGNGTAPNLNGILNQDTAYSAGSFALLIPTPNKFDVLRTAIAQVVAAQFMPTHILMHPDDIASMDLTKGTDGHYVMPPFKSAGGLEISGVKIVGNTGQTVDKFTVGDFSKLNIRIREDFGIDVGYDGNDFTNNLVTILGEMRLVAYIKSNHATAFVSGDFSDAITALTKP